MLHKNQVIKQLEIVVTVVFYAVMLALLLVIVSAFSKELYARYASHTETMTMTSSKLPVINPAYENRSNHLNTHDHNPIAEDDSNAPTIYQSIKVFPCEVIVKEDPGEVVSAVSNAVDNSRAIQTSLFNVPLDAALQKHIVTVCEAYQVDPALVISIIKQESEYNPLAIGDNGASEGLMQIKRQYQGERMGRLGCNNLFDPKQNILVGIDLLAELLNTYETTEMALMVYNAGATGAHTYWFSNGIYSTEYSQSVLHMTAELHHQLASQTVKYNLTSQELRSVE